ELINLFGEEVGDVDLLAKPTVIMVVGLQGSGKTTTAAKLANRFKNRFNKKVLLVSLDIYRPAAQEQLRTLATKANIDNLEIIKDQRPIDICKRALKLKDDYDVVIFDTAGRLYIDQEMMKELVEVKDLVKPTEVVLVADSLTGQEAVNIASEFDKQIGINSIILTRVDGDGRGGAILSMRVSTGCPIRYVGTGEKIGDIDIFHPKRVVSRILDMGDIVSFVEKAEELVSKEEAGELETKLKGGKLDLEDFLKQIRMMKKFGGIANILSFIPGATKIKEFVKDKGFGDDLIKKQEAIVLSMTKKERKNPEILNSSRKFRIAAGSGTKIQDVNSFLKKFKEMKNISEKIGSMDKNQLKGIMKSLGDFNNEAFG
ncbi:MAG: signal recognition particle protein Srp54, partial [Rickettsiales bacterium]|nr:signal recognition particle protein Srp54 [Rickettsiales bacterium]